MTSRVSPCGSTQSPASIPANAGRSACATWPTVTPNEPASAAIQIHVDLGLVALGRQADVHGARHLAHLVAILSARPDSVADFDPRSCSWICLKSCPKNVRV